MLLKILMDPGMNCFALELLDTLCHCVLYCRKYLKQLYTDSLVHDEQALKYLVSTIGEERVVLGSDYPFPLGEHHPGKLIESIEDWDQEMKVCSYLQVLELF